VGNPVLEHSTLGPEYAEALKNEIVEKGRRDAADRKRADRKRDIGQLARDLLLTVVRRGDQQIDPAAIYDVARRFVEAGEAE